MAAFRARCAQGELGEESRTWVTSTASCAGWMVGGLLGLVAVVTGVVLLVQGDPDAWVALPFVGAAALLGWGVSKLAIGGEGREVRRTARLAEFATSNGLDLQPAAPTRALPGSIFVATQAARTVRRLTWRVDALAAEAAVRLGSQPSSRSRYLAVQLGRDLPAMAFDCGRTGPASPHVLVGTEVFPGERYALVSGSPDRARLFFGPDLVHLLTHKTFRANAEVVEGWFFAYFSPGVDELSPALWRHTFEVAEAVARSLGDDTAPR